MWFARARTPGLRLGDPIEFRKATLVDNLNAPSMLSIEGHLDRIRTAMTPGNGIVLSFEGNQRFSGIASEIERRGDDTGTIIFAGDFVRLRHRFVQPVPGALWSTPGQNAMHDRQTGPAETRLLAYIDRNAGPAAFNGTYDRRIPRLRVPTSQGRGASSTTSARFQNLGDLVAKIAEEGSLRVEVVQTFEDNDFQTAWLDVKVTPVPDLTAWARFGTAEAGGPAILSDEWSYKIGIPGSTVVLSAAGGEGSDRILNYQNASDPDAGLWGYRIEHFIDQRGTTEAAEITTGMISALEETLGAREVSAPLGRSTLLFGDDIPLGAKVAVSLDGEMIQDRIRQITTEIGGEGATDDVTAMIGTSDVGLTSPTQKRLAAALKRISNIERNA